MSKKTQIKWFQKRSCVCKVKYNSLKSGLNALLECRDKGMTMNNVYRCFFCGGYHIGHSKKQTRKDLRKIIKILGEYNGR